MKAKVTRTLQAPQYAPICMELEEECTPEQYTATLNKLADIIENTLRERYPQYSGVLPIVKKKEEAVPLSAESKKVLAKKLFKHQPSFVHRPTDKVITIQKGAALVEAIRNSSNLSQLKGYEFFLDSDEAEAVYNNKLVQLQNKEALCK